MTYSTAAAQAHLIISDGFNNFPSLLLPWQASCQIRYHLVLCSGHGGGIKAERWCELQRGRRGSFGCNAIVRRHSLILTQSVLVQDVELSLRNTSPVRLGPTLGAATL